MMSSKRIQGIALVTTALALTAAGCAAPGAAPEASTDEGLEPTQIVTSGSWTANASGFSGEEGGYFEADAFFTGPPLTSRKVGVCPLQEWTTKFGAGHACSTVTDCASYPTTVPTGGTRYCAGPDGSSTKYCFYRPGPQSLCAGSPAQGGAPQTTDANGNLILQTVVSAADSTTWISYACFEGCTVTDPSSSSQVVVTPSCYWSGQVRICQ